MFTVPVRTQLIRHCRHLIIGKSSVTSFLSANSVSSTTLRFFRRSIRPIFLSVVADSPPSSDDHHKTVTESGIELPQIIQTKGVPIHLFAEEIKKETMNQIIVLAESPIPVDFVAVMADAHGGTGAPVGTVFASEKYVAPNAVGVDIGCGMAAIPIHGLYKDDLTDGLKSRLKKLIKRRIPTGSRQYKYTPKGTKETLEEITEVVQPTEGLKQQLLLPHVTDQLGTLGGGNHFIEVLYCDESEQVWCMLHSGSRSIGKRVAQYYDEIAQKLLRKQGVNTFRLNGINYMEIDSQEGQDYLRDMEWCQQYAFHNRRVMKEVLLKIMYEVVKKDADLDHSVNIHHNYCKCEDCGGGRKLFVTRKGATSAAAGEMGIIPGSMGTGSYITRGRGNMMSWRSSSHGAGRRMSRIKAHSSITQEDFERSMEGIVCDTHPSVKDEAPQAYKDLAVVMKQQESLTDIVHRLLPLINVKGFDKKLPKKYQKSYPKSKKMKAGRTPRCK
jgi:tRNA-splicing ligase RtcB (3'-phosphate/5'-hydroxy nucleic acid ligase)